MARCEQRLGLRLVTPLRKDLPFDRLDARDRLILRLFLVSGATLRTIGESLGLSQQAISKRIANARAALMKDVREAVAGTLQISEDE